MIRVGYAGKNGYPYTSIGGVLVSRGVAPAAEMTLDRLRAWLAEAGVGTEIYYPVPLHLQRCFSALGYGPGSFPESERAALETLALPIYPELSDVQLQHVVDTMAAFYS